MGQWSDNKREREGEKKRRQKERRTEETRGNWVRIREANVEGNLFTSMVQYIYGVHLFIAQSAGDL